MKRILNVGCGSETYGTDFIDFYPSRKGVIKCNVDSERFPFKDRTFDKVYSNNLFEHLKDPNSVLMEMARVLKKSGRLVLKTDNSAFWLYHNDKSSEAVHSGGYESHGSHGSEDRHYALYTPHHLRNHLLSAGITPEKVELYSDFGSLSVPIRMFNNILAKTRFRSMAYPKIMIVGTK